MKNKKLKTVPNKELGKKFDMNPSCLMDDSLFTYILVEIPEFKEYNTGFDDLSEGLDTNLITPEMRKKILDSLFRRPNNEYINIEHQTNLNTKVWKKCLLYYALLENKYDNIIKQFIFYTGELKHIKDHSLRCQC